MSKHDQQDEIANEKARQAHVNLMQDYRIAFQGDSGFRVLQDLAHRFEIELPVFRTPDLAARPAENCTIAAAIRDGNVEVVRYILAMKETPIKP